MIGSLETEASRPVRVSGYGQDFDQAIIAVEFSADEGCTWTRYAVDDAEPERNVNWSFEFTPPLPGLYRLLVRAVRADGSASPEPASVNITAYPHPA